MAISPPPEGPDRAASWCNGEDPRPRPGDGRGGESLKGLSWGPFTRLLIFGALEKGSRVWGRFERALGVGAPFFKRALDVGVLFVSVGLLSGLSAGLDVGSLHGAAIRSLKTGFSWDPS